MVIKFVATIVPILDFLKKTEYNKEIGYSCLKIFFERFIRQTNISSTQYTQMKNNNNKLNRRNTWRIYNIYT